VQISKEHDPGWGGTEGLKESPGLRILYIQYTNPGGYPPLEHSSRILAEAGWKALFLGTGALGANVLALPANPRIQVRRMPFCRSGWRQKPHYLAYCAWALWTAIKWRPTWIYASDPLACPIALLLRWMPGVKLLYHEHDSPDMTAMKNLFGKLVRSARHAVARRAELCVLPSSKRLDRFQSELGPVRNSLCVWNCPARCETMEHPRPPASENIWVLYHGSIVRERIPPSVLEALTLLPDRVKLRVAGYETAGSAGYVAELKSRAQALGIDRRVEFPGAIPQRADLLGITSQSDIGLALMPLKPTDLNFESMAGASNKPFDYMACGLALLVSDLPDWRSMFGEPGYALSCNPDDPASIASAISILVEHPGRMRAMGEKGRQRILSEWNYEDMFRPVLEHLSPRENMPPDGGRAPAIRNTSPAAAEVRAITGTTSRKPVDPASGIADPVPGSVATSGIPSPSR
jgi:glycosyltransferase involved in cell wall biosynthesis